MRQAFINFHYIYRGLQIVRSWELRQYVFLYLRPRQAQWFRCVTAFITHTYRDTCIHMIAMCIIHMYMTCMYIHVCPMQSKLCDLQRCWHFLVPGSSRKSFIDFVCADLRFYLVNLNLIHFRASMAEFWLGFGPNLYPPDLRGSQMAEQLFCWRQKAEAKSHER